MLLLSGSKALVLCLRGTDYFAQRSIANVVGGVVGAVGVVGVVGVFVAAGFVGLGLGLGARKRQHLDFAIWCLRGL